MSPDDRERLSAGLLDRLGRREDRAFELGMGLRGLGDQRHVCAVAGGAKPDRKADSAASAGDEEGLALEGASRHSARTVTLRSCPPPECTTAGSPGASRDRSNPTLPESPS